MRQCTATTGTDGTCVAADTTCNNELYSGITDATDFDVYDVRAPSKDPNPPNTYLAYLNDTMVKQRISAQGQFSDCADAPYYKFESTGDDARSFEAVLGKVIASGIQVTIWAGDADWICNYGEMPLIILKEPESQQWPCL